MVIINADNPGYEKSKKKLVVGVETHQARSAISVKAHPELGDLSKV